MICLPAIALRVTPMARQRFLANAPITEALIDLHVAPRDGLSYEGLSPALDASGFGYYVKGPISLGTFQMRLPGDGTDAEASGASRRIGLRMHSTDERYVAQFRVEGFTLSRLPPYEDWEHLVAETRRVWDVYVQRLQPKRVTRIATRYINNLRLPLEQGASFQRYLNKLVEVPDEAPQAVAAFLQRFQLVDTTTRASANLTLALNEYQSDVPAPVILDIDAFASADLDPGDPEIWQRLDQLRELKNRCFFGTITEQAAELYE